MFSEHFKVFFNAIKRAPLVAIIAFLMASIVAIGFYHSKALADKDQDCKELRSDDQIRLKEMTKILTHQQDRMMDAILKESAKNDSVIKKQVEKEINTIMP